MHFSKAFSGLLIFNKPKGQSSGQVSRYVGRLTGVDKIGHGGTLDPMAEGVLPLLLGSATKMSDLIMQEEKAYRATVHLGIETDTYDAEGQVISEKPLPENLDAAQLQTLLATFAGDILQQPPAFSAKKIKGVPAYALARKQKPVTLSAKPVHVFEITLERFEPPFVQFYARVSKGTYIRSMAHDLGQRLGCGAHLSALTRTACGPFSLEQSVDLPTLEQAAKSGDLANLLEKVLIPETSLIRHLPEVRVEAFQEPFILGGGNLETPWIFKALKDLPPTTVGVRLVGPQGRLLALLRRAQQPKSGGGRFAYLKTYKSTATGENRPLAL